MLCSRCRKNLNQNEFYKNNRTSTGYTYYCKKCIKEKSKEYKRIARARKGITTRSCSPKKTRKPRLIEHLTGSEKAKRYRAKYPEKYNAGKAIRRFDRSQGHNHHWSYNEEHYTDVIILKSSDHLRVHKFLIYDKILFKYRTLDKVLLETKDQHFKYIKEIIENNIHN